MMTDEQMNTSIYIQEDYFISLLTYCSAPLGYHVISLFEVRHDFCWRNPCLLRTTFLIRYWSPLSSIAVIKRPVMCEKCRHVMESMSLLALIGKYPFTFSDDFDTNYDMHWREKTTFQDMYLTKTLLQRCGKFEKSYQIHFLWLVDRFFVNPW